MGLLHFSLFILLASLPWFLAQEIASPTLVIDGTEKIASTDDDFICATIDWWPPEKCNYDMCPWGLASVINLNLSQPLLQRAVQAFKSLRIRVGGSLQDQVIYDVGNLSSHCRQFRVDKYAMFGFSGGCLHMDRWDELNRFFIRTGAIVTFGLNALIGRHQVKPGVWGGKWDSTNARNFMKYTAEKGYPVDSWELGNELSGKGVGASVRADQYAHDVVLLKAIIKELYKDNHKKASVVAPGGSFDQKWFADLLRISGPGVLDAVTQHIYNLGSGSDPKLISHILDPYYLSGISSTFSNLDATIYNNGRWAAAWVSESGGAYNSGGPHVSDTFVNSFWYLDQLGMASKYNTKVYCRQSLVGGFYGLLDKTTFIPNPDYYSALLWHQLMGKGVLLIDGDASAYLRYYAHCTKGREGITLLLINLSNQTTFKVNTRNGISLKLHGEHPPKRANVVVRALKRAVSFTGEGSANEPLFREEYHLTPKDGVLQSQTVLLNGIPLEITENGNIPALKPALVDVRKPLSIAPYSIAFVVYPNFDAPACI
ncbi:hypothetical protein MLD38_026180 [Melastoma candidum]|uniref:Uncharacterized protein n=1 Tax=Melastoma candidum TaxID=119954 RepID=A0ACB9NZK7_9MYRT|nr:hypothetical protein MLD38_026180 [Melastoma candidum]